MTCKKWHQLTVMQSQELIAVRKQGKEKQVKALALYCDQHMATLRICDEIFPWHRGPTALCCSAHLGVRGWHSTRAEEAPAHSGAVERQSAGKQER